MINMKWLGINKKQKRCKQEHLLYNLFLEFEQDFCATNM